MTDDGAMTGRPYGGVNKKPDDADRLPGEVPEKGKVEAPPAAEEPRAARAPMSEDVTETPGHGTSGKAPHMPDATGPTG